MEGITNDPKTNGFVAINEKSPEGLFQTTINFAAGTASNGSATTAVPTNLFDPSRLGLADFSDVYALSNLPSLAVRSAYDNLLVPGQETGKLAQTDRAGNVLNSLTITRDAADTLSVAQMQFEGVTMDDNGILYLTAENGGNDADHPQICVYAPTPEPAAAGVVSVAVTLLARRYRR